MITLTDMAKLAHALKYNMEEVEKADKILKATKETVRQLKEESIPSAMQELGLTKLVLDSGDTITIKQEVYASIPVANRTEAFKWLFDHGFGGLIKVEVKSSFGKGDFQKAKELTCMLQNDGFNTEFKESVVPQTLKAFLKEQMADANPVPLELFGARPVTTATIK